MPVADLADAGLLDRARLQQPLAVTGPGGIGAEWTADTGDRIARLQGQVDDLTRALARLILQGRR